MRSSAVFEDERARDGLRKLETSSWRKAEGGWMGQDTPFREQLESDLEEGHRIVVHVDWEPHCPSRGNTERDQVRPWKPELIRWELTSWKPELRKMSPVSIYRMDWRKEVWGRLSGCRFLNPGDKGPGYGSSEINQEGLNSRCLWEEDQIWWQVEYIRDETAGRVKDNSVVPCLGYLWYPWKKV